MERIATGTRKLDLFGAGKDGFTAGNPNSKIAATQLSAVFFNSIQEEIAGVIEDAGITLDVGNNGQLTYAVALGGKYNYSWLPPPGWGVNRPFEWSSEPAATKVVAGAKAQMLVETYTHPQNSVAAIGDFTPANKTCGTMTFEVVISCDTGTPTAQSHRTIEGKVWWQKSGAGVVTFEAITETYNAGLLAATVATPVGGGVVGILVTIAANVVYANFNLQARSWLNLLPFA